MNDLKKLEQMGITVKDDRTVEEDIKCPEMGDSPYLETVSFVEEDKRAGGAIKAYRVGGDDKMHLFSVTYLYRLWEQGNLEVGFYG